MPFLDVKTVMFIPPADSWSVNSNFRSASHMQSGAFFSDGHKGAQRLVVIPD